MKINTSETYISKRSKPLNFEDKDHLLFSKELLRPIPNTYYLFDKNVFVNDHNLYKYKYLNKYIPETKMDIENSNFLKNSVKKLIRNSNKTSVNIIDKASWVIDDKSFNYFHWMTDVLSRIALIPPSLLNDYPIMIPIDFLKKPFIKDSLNILGIHYVTYQENKEYKINQLLITSHVAPAGNFNKHFIIKVKDQLLEAIETKTNPSRRVWLSRKNQQRRTLVNEDEIFDILANFNFEIILPEDLSLTEQLNIFSETSFIAGTHGAALTNAMFMKPKSSILEVRASNDSHRNPFFTLASEFDLKYYYLLADPKINSLESDLYLNPEKLNNILLSIL